MDEAGVFFPGYNVIGVAKDVEERDLVWGKLIELVHRIAFPGERGGFIREVPEFEHE